MSGGVQQQQEARQAEPLARHEWISAINHPLRIELLAIWSDRAASPAELARELGDDVGVINYHARKLERMGLVEIVDERPVRGSTEHFYRATQRAWFSTEQWLELKPSVRSLASAWTVDRLIADLGVSLNAGAFDRRGDRHLSRSPIVLDEQGWEAVTEILDRTLDEILEQQAKSTERMATSGEDPIAATIGMMSFETPAAPPIDPAPSGD